MENSREQIEKLGLSVQRASGETSSSVKLKLEVEEAMGIEKKYRERRVQLNKPVQYLNTEEIAVLDITQEKP